MRKSPVRKSPNITGSVALSCVQRDEVMGDSVVRLTVQEVLTRLEVMEGSDLPRFREHIRSRLEVSADVCCVCCRLPCRRRYFPAEQQQDEVQLMLHAVGHFIHKDKVKSRTPSTATSKRMKTEF